MERIFSNFEEIFLFNYILTDFFFNLCFRDGEDRDETKGNQVKKCLNDIFKNLSDIKLFLEIVIFLMNQEEEKEKQKKIFSKKSRRRSHWHSINGKQ